MIAASNLTLIPALTPEDIAREVRNLPSAPRVVPHLKRLLSDGNSAMHEIVALIRLDPGIAARVLQTANSAYFSKGVRCATVDEAVHRVGYDQVYHLVSYAVASQVLVRPVEAYGIDADELWKMSVACALAAEALAERLGQDRKIAYTIGLLHCLGMVAIDEWALRNAAGLSLANAGFPQEATASEREKLGFTQADVGGALLVEWEFPLTMSQPVRWQYAPSAAGAHQKMAGLLVAAKWIRGVVCSQDPEAQGLQPDAACVQRVGLSAAAFKGVVAVVTRRLAEVSSLLDSGKSARAGQHHFPVHSESRP